MEWVIYCFTEVVIELLLLQKKRSTADGIVRGIWLGSLVSEGYGKCRKY